jgi:hypothetical protein
MTVDSAYDPADAHARAEPGRVRVRAAIRVAATRFRLG